MAGYFEAAPGGGAVIVLDTVEVSILRSLAVQLLEMIGPGKEPVSDDPLAALFTDGPTKPPSDPALARLFPDAYEDTAQSSEFRRFTENDLRTRKREDVLALVRSLDAGGPALRLTPEESRRWLGALNDLRLTIGTRLEVTDEDTELYRLPDDDPLKPMVMAYLWLGGLQETLIETL
ncbi:DUF2017 domain-containing protein [Streptomyces sp. H10-C2]|uniref:DUF2017 domain-containing protein n=1 Tax=unclassified Streptomyces TaxID=2593676 RepID=UPI0024B8EEE9|nr:MULTISPECIES: DUF2017 domain-containing protein [unclassified Streptomyces]MDJ0344388.1 DUF2017 domain-containing protein [Streptomyces sp. PH10-H1]MDJ0373757.1 DUF2017 domain-containing protein [Streptomyces sp. H10-C2]